MKKILFTGGGSAGHVTPNIAVIEEILQSGEADVCYMGSNGIEKGLIEPLKIPYFTISPPKFRRGLHLSNLCIPSAFKKAVEEAKEGLKAFSPSVVFSKGGFVALPVAVAASKLSVPCLTHESDRSAGLANRLMASRCKAVLTSFPETADEFKNGKFVGSPLRKELFRKDRSAARKKYGLPERTDRKTILVFGGGSGSKAINEALKPRLIRLCEQYDVLHICGKGNATHDRVRGYTQMEFETDMGSAYAASDLVVCRAGSNTIFEILALKKPSILVPLQGQTRGDQLQNAKYFARKKLTHVLLEKELSSLPEAIERALADDRLQSFLAVSDFSSGNANVLREIRRYL